MGRVGCDIGDDEAHQDGPATEDLLIVKLAASVPELACGRGEGQGSAGAVGVIQSPLARLRIVKAQGQGLETTRRPVDFELNEVGPAVPDLPDDARP
jgi:hypothetical protein